MKKKSKDAGQAVQSEVKSVRNSLVTIKVRAAEEQRCPHRLWKAHEAAGAADRICGPQRSVLEQEKTVRRRRKPVMQ